MMESLGAIKRAGADLIFSYFALDLAERGLICRPDKRSAIRHFIARTPAGWRLTPYPAYMIRGPLYRMFACPAFVGRISAAPSGISSHISLPDGGLQQMLITSL
ncbi:Hypothetical protein ABZS17I87_00963 [Kosakonia cowanii]